jgi:cobalt-zinc-cadmium efflux system membrane fusion protein
MNKNSAFIFVALLFFSCSKKEEHQDQLKKIEPVVDINTKTVTFPTGSPGVNQFQISEATSKGQFISVVAPGRVVAAILPRRGREPEVFFGSPDLNELYFQYAQRLSTKSASEKNYQRTKDMFSEQAATQRDLKEAERDWTNSKFAELEFENKLKGQGIVPDLIGKTLDNIAYVACDVPESQLFHVELNEDVDLYFNSFGQEKFQGKVISMGNVIDPVSRTLKVTVKVKNPTNKIKAGMFAKVEFGDFRSDLVSIPVDSVITIEGRSYVFLVKAQNSFSMQPVSTAAFGDSRVGVLQGVKAGEKVISRGALLLKSMIFGN